MDLGTVSHVENVVDLEMVTPSGAELGVGQSSVQASVEAETAVAAMAAIR